MSAFSASVAAAAYAAWPAAFNKKNLWSNDLRSSSGALPEQDIRFEARIKFENVKGQHTARELNVRCDPIANDLDILNSGKLIGHVNALGQVVGGASTRQKVHALRLVDDILANLKNSAIAHDTDVAVAADILVIFAVGVIVVGIGISHDEYFQFNDEWKSKMCHFGLPRPSDTRYDCPSRASHVHLCPIRDTHSSRNALVREVLPLHVVALARGV
jgi:hypothetical protein